MLSKTLIAAAAAFAGLAALPSAAAAHDPYGRGGYDDGYYDDRYDDGYYRRGYDGYDDRRRHRRYRRGDYYGHRRCGDGTTGAIVGGFTGAMVGRDIDRGGRRSRWRYRRDGGGTGAIIGGAVGALVGREIARSGCR